MKSSCLDLDVGNSRIKWRCGSARGACSLAELPNFSSKVNRVRVSSVSFDKISLQTAIQEHYGIEPEFAEPTRYLTGVSNGYEDETQLGIDRWLALVAAYNKMHSSVMVIDAGTAVTLDFVNSEGLHLGGYIVPGLQTLRKSLSRDTALVQVSTDPGEKSSLGLASNTDQAVNNGCLAMLCAFIEESYRTMCGQYRQVFRIFLSGGDSELIAKSCPLDFTLDQDLIFDGLALALP